VIAEVTMFIIKILLVWVLPIRQPIGQENQEDKVESAVTDFDGCGLNCDWPESEFESKALGIMVIDKECTTL
jgi:hypothetical protein